MSTSSLHSVTAQYDGEDESVEDEFAPEQDVMTVAFSNVHPRDSVELYRVDHQSDEDDPNRLRLEATIPPRGGVHRCDTFVGQEFAFRYDGEMWYTTPDEPDSNDESFVILSDVERTIPVRCDATTNSGGGRGTLDIHIWPHWAPRGATHFLELVRLKYYDGVVFHRVVPEFLTQFGVAVDSSVGDRVARYTAIGDDVDLGVGFQAGSISFAGDGPNSRAAEVFIAMPGASREVLNRFGSNEWERPFGMVVGDLENGVLGNIYSGYGDVPPWGKGPDRNLMYAKDGYTEYIPTNFPLLDKIIRCYIVEEVGLYGDDEP